MSTPQPAVAGWRDGWFVVPYQVTWRDLDALGHVNNAVYLTFFEWARTKYWLTMNGGTDPRDISFIVARSECNFRRQLSFMDELEFRVRIAGIRNSSFDFVYEIVRVSGSELAADGTVVVVLFDWEANTKLPISAELRQRIAAFQKD